MTEKSIDFTQKALDLFNEQNKVRKDPKSYVAKLQKWLPKFREKTLYLLSENPMKTFEGKEAVEEAIAFLKKQNPLPELIWSKELSMAARDHVEDIGGKGLTTHEGSNDETVSNRIERYCEWDSACAETIDFGFTDLENVIMNIIVDDGVNERFQRMNMFSPTFKYVGIAMGKHRDLNVSCVFVYTKGVRDLGKPSNDGINYIQDYIQKTFYRKNPKNAFQEEDLDAPDDTVSVKIIKTKKVIGGKTKRITQKIYTLVDKTQHIIEIEEN